MLQTRNRNDKEYRHKVAKKAVLRSDQSALIEWPRFPGSWGNDAWQRKPNAFWAIASVVCSSLGCLLLVALFPLAEEYGKMANRSAGLGIIWMILRILFALAFCFLGIVCGINRVGQEKPVGSLVG